MAVSFMLGINDRCHQACLAATCTTRLFATLCRVAMRRAVAPIRSGRVGFSSSSLSLSALSTPFAAGPRSPSIIHPWRLRIYFGRPRGLSLSLSLSLSFSLSLSRLSVLMYRCARIHITPWKTCWSMFRNQLERVGVYQRDSSRSYRVSTWNRLLIITSVR